MAGPWEKYQAAAAPAAGPWTKYATQASTEPDSPSFLEQAKDTGASILGYVGQKAGQYGGGNAVRAGLGELEKSGSPAEALKTAYAGYGNASVPIPSGEDLNKGAGINISNKPLLPESIRGQYAEPGTKHSMFRPEKGGMLDPTRAGAAGFLTEVATDPLTYATGAAGKLGKLGKLGETAEVVGDAAKNVVKGAAYKTGSALTGLAEKDIKTYVERFPEVEKLIKETGGDVTQASDKVRGEFYNSILKRKTELGKELQTQVEKAPKEKIVDASQITDRIDDHLNRLTPELEAGKISEVGELKDKINALAGADGKLSPAEVFKVKNWLQDEAKGAYVKDGQFFANPKSSAYQMAAKSAGREAKSIFDELVPDGAKANTELSMLHNIEGKINKNMITAGKPESALLAAGSGTNKRAAAQLGLLSKFGGGNILPRAEELSAARSFGTPSILPVDTTGKAAARTGIGYLAGKAASELTGVPALPYIGAAATSPMVLKGLIKTGKGISSIAGKAGPTEKLAGLVGARAQERQERSNGR